MKQSSGTYRVVSATAFFGTVRVCKGDVVRRELLGSKLRKLIEEGIIEPIPCQPAPMKQGQAMVL
jgi:hypothetical protein